jgi:hypothetical protein
MARVDHQEQQGDKPKRQYVRRRKADARSSLNIAFEKIIPTGRGRYAGRRSAADVLIEKECERALAGSERALKAVLRHNDENQKALDERYSVMKGPEPKAPDKRKLVEAALILDIFNLDVGIEDRRSYRQDRNISWWERWSFLVSEWAAEAGLRRREEILDSRTGGRHMDRENTLEQVAEFTADRYIRDPLEPEIRKHVLADLYKRRADGAGQWSKGRSGNPHGGAIKYRKFELPFGYLEELVVVNVLGRERELTRFEALIWQLQDKASHEDQPASRQLAAVLANKKLADWTPKYWGRREQPETTEERERTLLSSTPRCVYECLGTLGILGARAKKSYLLDHWIVELALARLGSERLTFEEQKAVMRVTRKPHDHIWPQWWDESLFGPGGRKPYKPPIVRKPRRDDADRYIGTIIRR